MNSAKSSKLQLGRIENKLKQLAVDIFNLLELFCFFFSSFLSRLLNVAKVKDYEQTVRAVKGKPLLFEERK
jgi:hypothetical protein